MKHKAEIVTSLGLLLCLAIIFSVLLQYGSINPEYKVDELLVATAAFMTLCPWALGYIAGRLDIIERWEQSGMDVWFGDPK